MCVVNLPMDQEIFHYMFVLCRGLGIPAFPGKSVLFEIKFCYYSMSQETCPGHTMEKTQVPLVTSENILSVW